MKDYKEANVGEKRVDYTDGSAARKINETSTQLSDGAQHLINEVGEKVTSLAGSIRKHSPSEGSLGSAAVAVADTLESGGQYLAHHTVRDISEDLTSIVRRYPMHSLWIGIGLGALIGTTFSRR